MTLTQQRPHLLKSRLERTAIDSLKKPSAVEKNPCLVGSFLDKSSLAQNKFFRAGEVSLYN